MASPQKKAWKKQPSRAAKKFSRLLLINCLGAIATLMIVRPLARKLTCTIYFSLRGKKGKRGSSVVQHYHTNFFLFES